MAKSTKTHREVRINEVVKVKAPIVEALQKSVDNPKNPAKMKIGLQFFARNSKDYKTVELPKQEYAHIMSELATHLTDAQRKQKVVTKAIGKFVYTIENNGFGEYRVIGKKTIDNEILSWWED